MSQIFKSFLGLFMILLMLVLSVWVLNAYMSVVAAQNLHASFINEIEDSNFSAGVIGDCFEAAEQNNYQLNVTLYSANGGATVYSSKGQLPADLDGINMAYVVLKFELGIDGIGNGRNHELCGYAR